MKIIKEDFKARTFKQLVQLMSEANSEDDALNAAGQIDVSFQHDKINWNDHQMLYALVSKVIDSFR